MVYSTVIFFFLKEKTFTLIYETVYSKDNTKDISMLNIKI